MVAKSAAPEYNEPSSRTVKVGLSKEYYIPKNGLSHFSTISSDNEDENELPSSFSNNDSITANPSAVSDSYVKVIVNAYPLYDTL
jgi:hypothetical protein